MKITYLIQSEKRKIFSSILIVLSLLLSAPYIVAQNQQINITGADLTLRAVFKQIEKQTKLSVDYDAKVINTSRPAPATPSTMTLDEAMKLLLRNTGCSYSIQGSHILIVSQSKSDHLTGFILDENGESIIGANIIVKGTTSGTVSDLNGNFSLKVSLPAVLQISYIGYVGQEVAIGNYKEIVIKLKEDTQSLSEVIVVGYGTQRRKDFTGSVSSLKLENSPIALAPNTNALEALKGTTPGLDIGATTKAGQTPGMQIRGQKSINGSNDPLIVLDGIVFLGSLRDIDPNSIASYDVLKDATSAAVYGSRAANGVIMITTKKGKSGKPVIAFNTSVGFQTWQQRPDIADPETYIRSVNAKQNSPEDADPISWMQDVAYRNYKNGKTTNMVDLITRNGLMQNYQTSVSGGTEDMDYFLSASYTDQETPVVSDEFSRLVLNAKFNTKITDWLNIGVSGSYAYSDYSGISIDVRNALVLTPYGQVYRDEENKLLEKYPNYGAHLNPLWGTDGTVDDVETYNNFRVSSYLHIKFPFMEGLSYRFNWMQSGDFNHRGVFNYEGYYIKEGEGLERYNAEALTALLPSANGTLDKRNNTSYVFDNILNYKRIFGKHSVDATFVYTRDYFRSKLVRTQASDFSANGNTILGIDGLSYGTIRKIAQEDTRKANIGYLGRVNYTFDDCYHLTASYRRDGSSVFGINNKWGDFGAVGLAWTLSNEPFMKSITFFDYLKLRVSWGKNGNQGVSPYGTLSKVISGSTSNIWYEYGNNHKVEYGMSLNSLGNYSLGWETTGSFNGGFESQFLDSRISLNLDFYFSRTTDQLFTRQIPAMIGYNTILASIGEVGNKGVELNIDSKNIEKKDFQWNTRFIFALNRNKLIKLYGDDMDGDGKEDDDIGNSLFIGKSLSSIYGYEAIGIVQESDAEYMEKNSAKPGDVKFRDLDGDGVISASKDRKILGNGKENFKLNLSNTFNYKNFQLYFLLTGIFGGNGYYQATNRPAYITTTDRYADNMLDHSWWTPENKSNKYPSATYNDSRFLGLQSKTFIRLQDITLSYTFSKSVLNRIGLNSLSVFATGKNLFYLTGWDGGDPEVGQTLSNIYPVPSSYTLGLNVSF